MVRLDRGVFRFASLTPRPLGELPLDAHGAAWEVDVLDAEREQLADPEPEPGLGEDHGPVALRHGPGERRDLLDRQRHDRLPFMSGRLDADDGRGGHQSVEDRGPVHTPEQPDRLSQGGRASTLDRSVAHVADLVQLAAPEHRVVEDVEHRPA
jgi:hypothetical protein